MNAPASASPHAHARAASASCAASANRRDSSAVGGASALDRSAARGGAGRTRFTAFLPPPRAGVFLSPPISAFGFTPCCCWFARTDGVSFVVSPRSRPSTASPLKDAARASAEAEACAASFRRRGLDRAAPEGAGPGGGLGGFAGVAGAGGGSTACGSGSASPAAYASSAAASRSARSGSAKSADTAEAVSRGAKRASGSSHAARRATRANRVASVSFGDASTNTPGWPSASSSTPGFGRAPVDARAPPPRAESSASRSHTRSAAAYTPRTGPRRSTASNEARASWHVARTVSMVGRFRGSASSMTVIRLTSAWLCRPFSVKGTNSCFPMRRNTCLTSAPGPVISNGERSAASSYSRHPRLHTSDLSP